MPTHISAAVATLQTEDGPAAERAVARLGAQRGSRYAAQALEDAVRSGLPDELLLSALAALGSLRVPQSLDTLSSFASHRRYAVRLAAYRGMVTLGRKEAIPLLEAGLGDSDPRVRGACANGLATLGAIEALDTLLVALGRGVPEAAPAIGQLGNAQTILRYEQQLGRQPLSTMLKGYWAFLERRDLDEASKLAILATLGEVATPEVKRFLQRIYVAVNWRFQPRVKQVIEQTIARIPSVAPAQAAPPGATP